MRRIKRLVQKILLWLLKKLNMPIPFKDFYRKDMILIEKELYLFIEKN